MPHHYVHYIYLLTHLMTLQQSVNHVTNSRNSVRYTATSRRLRDPSISRSDRGDDGSGGGEDRTSGRENIVTEEHKAGFKLRVRFIAADSPRRVAAGVQPSTNDDDDLS